MLARTAKWKSWVFGFGGDICAEWSSEEDGEALEAVGVVPAEEIGHKLARCHDSKEPLDPFRDFEEPACEVLATCEAEISAYPPSLRRAGLGYLRKLKLTGRRTRAQGITVLLPFWLNDIFGLSPDTCRLIARGSAYTLLYFLAQDELMDERVSDAARTELAALSSLFFSGLTRRYRSCFESRSPFWSHLDRYVEQWGESVLWERQQHWGQPAPYGERDLLLVARKAAPLKAPAAAMSLLADKEEVVGALDAMMDNAQLAFQMLDDLRDWRADLANQNYSYFLTRIAYSAGSRQLDPEAVEKAIFSGEAVDVVLDLALKHNQMALDAITTWNADYLRAFIEYQSHTCEEIRNRLQRVRERLLAAAFNELAARMRPRPANATFTGRDGRT